jgi:CheY-like chemotaxis protein
MKPGPAARQRPATVVVVDDDQTNLTLLRRILARRPGLDVLSESDGQRGLDLIRQQNPDLVLLDLHLPTMDGETIVRELRSDPATAATPVIVISGDTNPETTRRLQEAGATDYLAKPLNIQAFLDTINGLLEPLAAGVPGFGRPNSRG